MFKIQKMDLLVSIYIFCIVATELMGGKTFPTGLVIDASFLFPEIGLLPLNASVAIFLFPLIFTINDVITEVFGKERARSVIRSGLITVALIFLVSVIFTALPPSQRFSKTEPSYDAVFGLSARIAAASLTAFALAEFLDVLVFVRLRKALGQKSLWLRNNLSNFASQFVDTSVFMFLAFYAFDKPFMNNFTFLVSLIIPYYLLKCFMSIIETPLVYLGVSWLKNDKS